MAQGQKQASIGAEPYEYGRGEFLLSCVEMPSAMRVSVDEGKPYLAMVIELDIPLLARLFDENCMLDYEIPQNFTLILKKLKKYTQP